VEIWRHVAEAGRGKEKRADGRGREIKKYANVKRCHRDINTTRSARTFVLEK
jgi:hypothetical protein